ncbi:MAG: YhcH/YjgK/YiaL family protein [Ruthenibacterium sp.]
MISGNINAIGNVSVLPRILQKALHFLQTTDLVSHETGRFTLDFDGVPVILQVLALNTAPQDTLRPEIHRANVDVQFLAAGGPERAVWYPDCGECEADEDLLDTPRDILFYRNEPQAHENTLELTVGSYAIYFPWDVHIPAIQTGSESVPIRKIVLKVPLCACLADGEVL